MTPLSAEPDGDPLTALRVVDLSTWIAGAYCTKLLADGGASVTKVESPQRDPLRRWSASGATIGAGSNGALFDHLAAGKNITVVDSARAADVDALHALLATADAVVWSRGSQLTQQAAFAPEALLAAHPHLTVTTITPFGLEGPWRDRPATEFTLQAWSGGIIGLGRGSPDRPPVFVGGQVGEWLSGTFAAIGTLASRRRDRRDGRLVGELVDVSMLEALAMCLTYFPVTFHDQLGRPMRRRRFVPTPGVAAASDGLVGLGCGTGQQWLDFCAMVGHPEWTGDPKLFLERTALAPTIDAWVGERTIADVLDLASAFQIPNAPVANGADVATIDHLCQRDTFVTNAHHGAVRPRPAVRLTPTAATRDVRRREPDNAASALPFSGVRILDMTAYWAGPSCSHILAMLGAEVIHLESTNRPDGARLVGGVPQSTEQFWERSPIFAALNTNKKSLTIDFRTPAGLDLLRRFAATCDVVIENYTPRVLDSIGLDLGALRDARPDLVVVRMPGFGLDGPWRDKAAFAFVIEDASGLTWMTGHPDEKPIEPYCIGDSNAGLHAAYGVMLALAHRDRTGTGCLVEAAMLDAALNISAEQIIEHSAYGAVLSRGGNRGPTAA
ncbi:MAG TPA: CoA transferase, partial [Ilumatobacteraceae bacterium]